MVGNYCGIVTLIMTTALQLLPPNGVIDNEIQTTLLAMAAFQCIVVALRLCATYQCWSPTVGVRWMGL